MPLLFERLKYTTNTGVSVNIELPERIVLIGGESGTGRSFVRKTALYHYNNLNINAEPVSAFDNYNIATIGKLSILRNKLILLDNADLYLLDDSALCEYINWDLRNQYVIFPRTLNAITAPSNVYAELADINGVITAVYPYS
jgi:ABC-type dipeptide/oligopeptide/nickel transport system ATPase component